MGDRNMVKSVPHSRVFLLIASVALAAATLDEVVPEVQDYGNNENAVEPLIVGTPLDRQTLLEEEEALRKKRLDGDARKVINAAKAAEATFRKASKQAQKADADIKKAKDAEKKAESKKAMSKAKAAKKKATSEDAKTKAVETVDKMKAAAEKQKKREAATMEKKAAKKAAKRGAQKAAREKPKELLNSESRE